MAKKENKIGEIEVVIYRFENNTLKSEKLRVNKKAVPVPEKGQVVSYEMDGSSYQIIKKKDADAISVCNLINTGQGFGTLVGIGEDYLTFSSGAISPQGYIALMGPNNEDNKNGKKAEKDSQNDKMSYEEARDAYSKNQTAENFIQMLRARK